MLTDPKCRTATTGGKALRKVITCASPRHVLAGCGMARVVTTGSRPRSDDATMATTAPLAQEEQRPWRSGDVGPALANDDTGVL